MNKSYQDTTMSFGHVNTRQTTDLYSIQYIFENTSIIVLCTLYYCGYIHVEVDNKLGGEFS